MNFSSYAGFYNNNYLRSSYEYIYAKILECQNIKYEVEEKIFTLSDGSSYKPDFFLYDEKNNLIKIVEIKSENKTRLIEAKRKIDLLKQDINIPIYLLQSKELKILCENNNLNFNDLKMQWINSNKTNQNHVLAGKFNPMFGHIQTKESKIKNGLKTSERFRDNEFKVKHSIAVKNAMNIVDKSLLGHLKDREIRLCKYCNSEFEVIITSKQEYCCVNCSSKAMFKLASQIKHDNNIIKYSIIKDDVINYAILNKDYINSIPYNKISTSFRICFDEILSKFNLKDDRNIFFAFYGKHTNQYKRLLNDLKNIINIEN